MTEAARNTDGETPGLDTLREKELNCIKLRFCIQAHAIESMKIHQKFWRQPVFAT